MVQNSSNPSSVSVALVAGSVPLGGSTSFLCNLGGELIRRNIPAKVLSFEKENPLASDFQRMNIPVLCLDQRRMIFEDRLKRVLQHLARFQPTVVVATLDATSFEVLRHLPPGIFRIGMGQSHDPNVYELLRHYLPWVDLVAVVSQTMKEKAEAMPEFAKVPVACLSYGVPMPPETDLPVRDVTKPLRILYHGRLYREQKRVHLFPQILEQLKASGIPFHWTIAGDGSEKKILERTMSSSPAQTISFPGRISYADVPALIRTHDICLLTSDYEGFGLSVVEAMGHGLVPVVSDLPAGIPEMVDETNGVLVPVEDVPATRAASFICTNIGMNWPRNPLPRANA